MVASVHKRNTGNETDCSMNDDMDEAVGASHAARRARTARNAPTVSDSDEMALRTSFGSAIRIGDLEHAREVIRMLASNRYGPAEGVERRL